MNLSSSVVSSRFALFKLLLFFLVFFSGHGKKSKKKFFMREEDTEDYDADVFCKSQSRLIKMEKSDEFFVVDTPLGSSILLQCKYCEEKDNGIPKTWSMQRHIFTGNITELVTSMDNNVTHSSVFITKDHSLVLRDLKETNMGLYFCKAPYVNTPEKSFNYFVDLSNKSVEEVRGSVSELKNYTQFYLGAANKLIANQTFLNNSQVKLKVFIDWSPWSECDSCLRKEGVRYRVGKCRIKVFLEAPCNEGEPCFKTSANLKNLVFDEKQNTERPQATDSEVADNLTVKENIAGYGIALSCKSLLLFSLSPELYNMTAAIPDFVFNDKCNAPCKGRSLKKGPRYRKSIILATGGHLTLVCPDSTIDSEVRWEHNKLRLYPNEGTDYIPETSEPRLYVDSFNTLYLFEVTEKESGNYTCFVDGLRMQEVKIIVLTRSIFFTKEFTRHLKYLGIVFILCFFIYLAGITVVCVKTQSEKKKNSRKSLNESKKLLDRNKKADDSDYSS